MKLLNPFNNTLGIWRFLNRLWWRPACAIFSGIMLTLAFPKTDLDLLAWGALVPLLIAIHGVSVKRAFGLGFTAGMVHYATLMYWLIYTMKVYGNLPWPVNISILLIFSGYLALFWGLFSALVIRMPTRPLGAMVVIPALWVAMELLRAYLFTGFPWEFIGHSQYQRLQIIQISDIFGVYGISFVIVMVNTIFMLICLKGLGWSWYSHGRIDGRSIVQTLSLGVVLLVMTGWYGHSRIQNMTRQLSQAPKMRVAVIQGNIDQSIKWNPENRWATIRKYVDLSIRSASQSPDLVVWPETAAPFYFTYQRDMTKAVKAGIRKTSAAFIIGSPAFEQKPDGNVLYFNSAYLIASNGTVKGRYDKVHLVPFGEYVPMKKWLPFLDKIVEHVGDFASGQQGKTLCIEGTRLGVLICYEAIFSYLSRNLANNGAQLLINITNDAWYGKTSAPWQHFSLAIFRAVETRRALVRSANTGISGFVDPVGRVLNQTPLFEDAVETCSLPLIQTQTLYVRFGDWAVLIILIGIPIAIGLMMNRR